MTRRTVAVAIVALAALSAAACQLVIGVEDEQGTSPRTTDAATGLDATGADGPSTTCVLDVPPPAPTEVDPTGNQGTPLFFAVRSAFSAVDGGAVGYDLDGKCTANGAHTPCKGSPNDGDRGIDNAFFSNFIAGLAIPNDSPDPALTTTNEGITAGTSGIFLAVYGYNGKDDDAKVSFAIVSSPGLVGVGCSDAGDAGTPGFPEAGPRWDGCDVWSIGDTTILANVITEVQPGYVAGGTLVVPYKDKDLVLRFAGTELRLRNAVVAAKLVKQLGRYELVNGIVAGRSGSTDLFQTAAGMTVNFNGSERRMCETPQAVDLLRAQLCPARDLRLAGEDPAAACDALSMAVGFTASPAAVGVPGPVEPPYACPPFDAACP
jgi:hypothetical protein